MKNTEQYITSRIPGDFYFLFPDPEGCKLIIFEAVDEYRKYTTIFVF